MSAPGTFRSRYVRLTGFWFAIALVLSVPAYAVQLNPVGSPFVAVGDGRVEWGDYDGDGDLDCAVVGDSPTGWVLKIYENLQEITPGVFQLHASLEGIYNAAIAWGDYDADGDLDLAASGWNGFGPVTRIYQNTGGTFGYITSGIVGVYLGDLEWGDFDNDGDLDLLLAGATNSGYITRIYRNTGAGFQDAGVALPGLIYPSVAWGDYDADGHLDFALAGTTATDNFAAIYHQVSGGFLDIGAPIPGLAAPALAWGDYDHDRDLDLLANGAIFAAVFQNNGGAFTDISAGLLGTQTGSASWADIENDGDLDILLTGTDFDGVAARVYENTGGVFTLLNLGLMGLEYGDAAWGDYDGDHDLDLLLTGRDSNQIRKIQLYRSTLAPANTPPGIPGGLSTNTSGDPILLSWAAPIDAQTHSNQLSYTLRISTSPLGVNVKAPMSNPITGYRRVVRLGNVHGVTTWPFVRPACPGTYYWSVQAVDAGYEGSVWSAEQSFFNPGTTRTIVASAGPNGSIAPSGSVPVIGCTSQTFTITPANCYEIADVLVDNVSVGNVSSYTFTNVTENHTISVVFGNGTAAPPERLQAWWTFDDLAGSKVRDLAHWNSGANAGTLLGGATLVPGLVGNALRCVASTDGMRVHPTGESIYLGPWGFAVDAWVYLYSGSSSSALRTIVNAGGFQFAILDRRLIAKSAGITYSAGGAQLSENAWHHVAVTMCPDLHIGAFYVDGAQRGATFSPTGGPGSVDVYIGTGTTAFNGLIDEVDLFRSSLAGPTVDGPVMNRIWSADCSGKRREFLRVPLHTTTRCRICAVFSNLTATAKTYDWSLSKLTGLICQGTPAFNPATGSISAPSGGTATAQVAITGSGCYRMDATAQVTGNTFFTEGIISGSQTCGSSPCQSAEAPRPATSDDLTSTTTFVLHNEENVSRTFPCRIEAIDGDTGEPIEFVSLNGLDWGVPVEQTVQIAAGDSAELSVTVNVDTMNPFLTDQILLSTDMDQNSVYEPLVSSLVEAFEDSTGWTIAGLGDPPAPSIASADVRIAPNPFRGSTSISFTLGEARDVQVSVYDVAGRMLRSLHSGMLEAGAHELSWDGRREEGGSVQAGIYFVKVQSHGVSLVTKVLQLR